MAIIKTGLIQMGLKADAEVDTPAQIRDKMIEAHIPLIEEAGKKGVQILSFQEVFNQPYFCPGRDPKWFRAAEKIPDGHTTRLMQEFAKQHGMVIVVPIYEEDSNITSVYYNTAAVIDADGKYLGKYRKTHIPDVAGFSEKHFFKPGTSNWPVFPTAHGVKLGVYICYDRHFQEGWRILGLKGAEYVVNPSATVAGLSEHLWKIERPAAAVASRYFVGAINRVGKEAPWDKAPWNMSEFYGTSYVVNPRGEFLAVASRDKDELLVADMDMDMIQQVRDIWQFERDRRPETYGPLTQLDL